MGMEKTCDVGRPVDRHVDGIFSSELFCINICIWLYHFI